MLVVDLDPSSGTNMVEPDTWQGHSHTLLPDLRHQDGTHLKCQGDNYAGSKNEASGRGPSAHTANPSSAEFMEAGLEEMLAKHRLEWVNMLLWHTSTSSGVQVDMVTADNLLSSAVGCTLLLALQIEGVQVSALVDMGS